MEEDVVWSSEIRTDKTTCISLKSSFQWIPWHLTYTSEAISDPAGVHPMRMLKFLKGFYLVILSYHFFLWTEKVQAPEFKLLIIFKCCFFALYSTSQFLFHILPPQVVIPIPFSYFRRVLDDPWDVCQIWFTTFFMLRQNSAEA